MNHNENAAKILNELSKKYNRTFEFIQLTYEVDGNNANFYRAVCREQGSELSFVAYYYLNGTEYLLSDTGAEELNFSDGEAILVDEYSNLLLNNMFAQYLIASDPNILFAIAEIGSRDHAFTIDDIEKGLEYCICNGSFDIWIKTYLFVNSDIENKDMFDANIVTELLKIRAYPQSVDIAYISVDDTEKIKKDYQDDIYMIGDRLEEDERVVRYSWYLSEKGNEITRNKNVKGV